MPPLKMPLQPYKSTTAREHLGDYERSSQITVDIHGHIGVQEAADLVAKHMPADGHAGFKYAPPKTREINAKQNVDRKGALFGLDERIAEMDRMLVDVMAISPWPPQLYPPVDPTLGAEVSEIINNEIEKKCAEHPKRLVGLGAVPLQDADNAIKELDRMLAKPCFKGIEIAAKMGSEELDVRRLDPFWAKCQEYDIPIFIHPTSFASDRFSAHYLTNIIGNPLDTTVAMHYLIFGGVLERYPDLKFVLSHGGAFAAAYAGRMDHAYGSRPDCRENISMPPSYYLEKFYPDSLVFTIEQLQYLISRFGADHVLIGTDYPFDMGEYDPVEHVYQVPGLSSANRDLICGGNALRLMHMTEDECK
ncbi:amidohydrolase [Gammaproteobacteria bacterium]|nr:amidohydrolase [Gammaproteobacteria bacterium]